MFEEHSQPHEMVHERTHESGAEEWFCPVCGRRFLMQWPPEYKKIILQPGDETAIHTGGKGRMESGLAQHSEETEIFDLLERELEPFIEWMEIVDFDRLWESEM